MRGKKAMKSCCIHVGFLEENLLLTLTNWRILNNKACKLKRFPLAFNFVHFYKYLSVCNLNEALLIVKLFLTVLLSSKIYCGYWLCRYEFRMNLKTGEVKETRLSNLTTEYPRINEKYIGRYIYTT